MSERDQRDVFGRSSDDGSATTLNADKTKHPQECREGGGTSDASRPPEILMLKKIRSTYLYQYA